MQGNRFPALVLLIVNFPGLIQCFALKNNSDSVLVPNFTTTTAPADTPCNPPCGIYGLCTTDPATGNSGCVCNPATAQCSREVPANSTFESAPTCDLSCAEGGICKINPMSGKPGCECNPANEGRLRCRPECVVAADCPSDKVCITYNCVDPCPGLCGINAKCEVKDHVPKCICAEGLQGNPYNKCEKSNETEADVTTLPSTSDFGL